MQAPLTPCARVYVFAILTLATCTVRAQPTCVGPCAVAQEQFICHLTGNSERRIGIYRPDGSRRCRVDYTRDGRTRSLWSSEHDYQFCVRKALDIIGLLESVKFKCRPQTSDAAGPSSRR